MHVRGSWLGVSLSRRIHALPAAMAMLLAIGFGPVLAGVCASTASGEITEYPAEVSALNNNLGGGPQEIAAGPEGDLWFTDGGSSVYRFSPSEGKVVKQFGAVLGSAPNDITAGPDNNIWFTEGSGGVSGGGASIGRIVTAKEELQELPVPSLGEAKPALDGITVGPDHNLWFTDVAENEIGRITTAGVVEQFALPAGNVLGQQGGGNSETAADSIAAGPGGEVWFTEPGSHAIGVISTEGHFLHQFPVSPADSPSGIAEGPDGDMWFTDPITPWEIGRMTPAGEVSEFPAPSAPWSIVKGPDGNMWFTQSNGADAGLGCIIPTGQITLHPEPTTGGNPDGITVQEGSIWFAELNADKLGRLSPVACGATSAPLAPILSGLSETAKTWREGNALAHASRKSKKKILPLGTTFSYDLNEPASVTFTFTEAASGRKVGITCVAQTNKNKKMQRCTRTVLAGTLTFSAHAGTNTVRFEGPISTSKKLRPGSYTLVVTATASGEHSTPSTLHFTIANS
jgi:streptogramin lyase